MNNPNPTSDQAQFNKARRTWVLLTLMCALGMLILLPVAESVQAVAKTWFIAPVLWLALAVPAAVGLHGHCLRGSWSAEASPSPEGYFRGITSIWLVLAVGVAISLGACLVSGSASPSIWPGALMLMLLILARPSSRDAID